VGVTGDDFLGRAPLPVKGTQSAYAY